MNEERSTISFRSRVAGRVSPSTRAHVVHAGLELARNLFGELNARGLRYCHWKSNDKLSEALGGEGDLDLLVHPADRAAFLETIFRLGFLGVDQHHRDRQAAIEHFYGFDSASGRLVHLHVYFRLVTGGTLLKNHELALQELLLQETRWLEGVCVPTAAAELLTLVVRRMLEAGSWLELVLFVRQWEAVRREVNWLLGPEWSPGSDTHLVPTSIRTQLLRLMEQYLPQVDGPTMWSALTALDRSRPDVWELHALGSRFRALLGAQALLDPPAERAARSMILLRRLAAWFRDRSIKKSLVPSLVIAVTGAESTGKSTLVHDLGQWLGRPFQVEVVHFEKPQFRGWERWVLAPLVRLRRWLPWSGSAVSPAPPRPIPLNRQAANECLLASHTGHAQSADVPQRELGLLGLRSWLLARMRYREARRARRLARQGVLVVCDRYPAVPATSDGPQLGAWLDRRGWFGYLARSEAQWYRNVPPPDLLVHLAVPGDEPIAPLERTRQTVSIDVPHRSNDTHFMPRSGFPDEMRISAPAQVRLDTSGPFFDVRLKLRGLVWKVLRGQQVLTGPAASSASEQKSTKSSIRSVAM